MTGSRRKPSRLLILFVLGFAYWQVGLVLVDYGAVWAQPEEFEWREYILMDGTSLTRADLRKGLNWRIFEYEPRSTRPLSHYVEIADTKFRAALWRSVAPHPSLSLTWLLLLVATPAIFYRLLRNLDAPHVLSAAMTALYIGNPGTLSLAAVDFRPSKALANFAIVAALCWASRLHRQPHRHEHSPNLSFIWLCAFMAISFLFDETALLSFVGVLMLFPRVVFGNARRILAFFALPLISYLMAFRAIPELMAQAGFDVPRLEQYGPAAAITDGASVLGLLAGREVLGDLPGNALNFLSDFFGLVHPSMISGWPYGVLWVSVAVCLAVTAGKTAIGLAGVVQNGAERGIAFRSLVLLLIVTFFANIMLHIVDNRLWGLHWLNTYWPIFFLIVLTLMLMRVNLHPAFLAGTACIIVLASTYNFVYVNNAFKTFFYYRTVAFTDVVTNRVNRFDVPRPDGAALRRKTRAIWNERGKRAAIADIPTELYYLVHDLRLIEPGMTHGRQGTLFDGHTATFDLVRTDNRTLAVHPPQWARKVAP